MQPATPLVLQEIKAGHGIGLAEAARQITFPKAPNTATVFRWCSVGVKSAGGRRVKLEHARIGHRIATTALAVERFIMELSDSGDSDPVRTPAQRSRASAKAEAELEAIGA